MNRLKNIKLLFLVIVCAGTLLISCSKQAPLPPPPENLAEFEKATLGKDPEAVAQFVLKTYNCKDCHRIDEDHKLALTEEIQQKALPFQGCKPLLAEMNVIAQVPLGDRTPDQQRLATEFQDYGCAFCHQIAPGKLGLTDIGDKLGFFHQGCKEGFCCADSQTSN